VNGKDLPTTWTLSHVRLGEWDINTDVDCDDSYVNEKVCNQPPVDVAIEQKIPHENYNPQAAHQHNDIALLRLAEPVKYTAYIRPICLPVDETLRSNKLVDKTLSVAGWGLLGINFNPLFLVIFMISILQEKLNQDLNPM
jgi:hypothetical protein